jgi:capsular polysaccharide transport system permease protein
MAHSKPVQIPKNPSWLTQILVLRALIGRQIQSRFGEYHLGFFWMILEPLTSVLVIGLVVGGLAQRTIPEIPYVFFLLNGFMLLQLLTSCMNAGVKAVGASTGLLVYPAVKLLDPFLARFLFQLVSTLFSYVIFCLSALWLGVDFSLANLGVVFSCYMITWIIGSGLGLMMGVAIAHYPEIEMVMNFVQRPLLFVSAVLFPSYTIPTQVRECLMWNPLVHTIEQARHALFPFYNAAETNLLYPSMFALVVLAMGLTMFQNNQQFLANR